MIIELRIRETKKANMRGKGGARIKDLIPLLSEDFPPSDFPKKVWNLGRNQRKQNGIRRERGRRRRGGEAMNKEIEK